MPSDFSYKDLAKKEKATKASGSKRKATSEEGGKKKRQRKTKDKDASSVKRPKTAYMYFCEVLFPPPFFLVNFSSLRIG
jgi:hypothetical protein